MRQFPTALNEMEAHLAEADEPRDADNWSFWALLGGAVIVCIGIGFGLTALWDAVGAAFR